VFLAYLPVGLVLGGGGGGTLDALPIPLGSLTELLTPPTLPGPAGMPLTPVVPAPALGVPTALVDPAVVPPAPAFCANEVAGAIKMAMTASAAVVEVFDIRRSPDWDRWPTALMTRCSSPAPGPHSALNRRGVLLITRCPVYARLYPS
jgi:hypothetical protein